jgi:hypothetical protein
MRCCQDIFSEDEGGGFASRKFVYKLIMKPFQNIFMAHVRAEGPYTEP